MKTCYDKPHFLLHEPGISQASRYLHALDPDNLKIDGQSLTDILNFTAKLSQQVYYYDSNLQLNDWTSFFSQSSPFIAAKIAELDLIYLEQEYQRIGNHMSAQPRIEHLQWTVDFLFQELILPWKGWGQNLGEDDNALSLLINKLIVGALSDSLIRFIALVNGGSRRLGLSKPGYDQFLTDTKWQLDFDGLFAVNDTFIHAPGGINGRLFALKKKLDGIFQDFLEGLRKIQSLASSSTFQQIDLLQSGLGQTQSHGPHLGLFFTYLQLYQHYQQGLNQLTAKHLDHFYKNVLCLKPPQDIPDQAHILFELQKQVESHHLAHDTLLKDGKGLNGKDIVFKLEEEIVVGMAQVADLKTLYVNHVDWYKDCDDPELNLVEGLYIAPKANSQDGLGAGFESQDHRNWPTLGSKASKQLLPQSEIVKDHPFGRVGFVLASPVLWLNEGKRDIKVTFDLDYPDELVFDDTQCTNFINALNADFYFLSFISLDEAQKEGLSAEGSSKALTLLAQQAPYPIVNSINGPMTPVATVLSNLGFGAKDIGPLQKHLEVRRMFKVNLSGEEAWIKPAQVVVNLDQVTKQLIFEINLTPEQPAVTFFDAVVLEEELATGMPVLKIELDQHIKIVCNYDQCQPPCCLQKCLPAGSIAHSPYELLKTFGITDTPTIEVEVCGVKNLIVQNEESLLDVNGPIFPFGTRPDIMDFNVVNPFKLYFLSADIIVEAASGVDGIGAALESHLNTLLDSSATDIYKIGSTEKDLNDFLSGLPASNDELDKLREVLDDNQQTPNLAGPNFYVGSKEIFCKAWQQVWININWQDKPIDFEEYYKAYVVKGIGTDKKFGLEEDAFEVNVAMLRDGQWFRENSHALTIGQPNPSTGHHNRHLFKSSMSDYQCEDFYKDPDGNDTFQQTFQLLGDEFFGAEEFQDITQPLESLKVDTPNGFVRLTLENQDFLHKDYPFILARQMMAFGRFPDEKIDDAVYEDTLGAPHVFNLDFLFIDFKQVLISIGEQIVNNSLADIFTDLEQAVDDLMDSVSPSVNPAALGPLSNAIADVVTAIGNVGLVVDANDFKTLYDELEEAFNQFLAVAGTAFDELEQSFRNVIASKIQDAVDGLANIDLLGNLPDALKVLIPNEPYTPLISGISLDYQAKADQPEHIQFFHLYPFANTYKQEDLNFNPSLFPLHTNQGSLFVGLKDQPLGGNLRLLLQLAETTADTETDTADIQWHYLKNNGWEELRQGFEILEDDTDGLTRSGIVKLVIPADIDEQPTIMPKGLSWIRVSVEDRIEAVAEAIGLHTQAVKARFEPLPESDTSRVNTPLDAQSISKLVVANSNIKTVSQPYISFNGKAAEGNFHQRTSELLRHKGRAITAFDYQAMVLEAFSKVLRAKTIQHSLALSAHVYQKDLELAPGFVLLAVIPDPATLPMEDRYSPKLSASELSKIRDYLKQRISPFIRLKVENPRYEGITVKLQVQLKPGKDQVFHEKKLQKELRLFLSPWVLGSLESLTFGRSVSKSSIVKFVESRDYVDFIVLLEIKHQEDLNDECLPVTWECEAQQKGDISIAPKTARSVLVAGEILICPHQPDPCERYDEQSDYPCHQTLPFHDCEKINHEESIQ